MKTQSPILSILFSVLLAGGFILAGGSIVAISFNAIQAPTANFHAPHFVTAAAGIVLLLGGLMVFTKVLAGQFGAQNLLLQWIQYVLVLLAILASSVVFLWAGFGAEVHNFAQTAGLSAMRVINSSDGGASRLIIGWGVVVTLLVMLVWGIFKKPTVSNA